MGLQKYRADTRGKEQVNGAIPWFTRWGFGPTLALVRNCPTPFGARTVYVRGNADTFFSIPAACEFRKRVITGYLTTDDNGEYIFRAYTYDSVYPEVKE